MRNQTQNTSRIVLVLDPGLTFHREIIAGIGSFSQAAGLRWVYEIETNILKALAASKAPDGFIVDADAVEEVGLLASMKKHPLVCVSSAVSSACPSGVPLLASDNAALIDLAIQHLRDTGITNFAFFSKAKYHPALWARERFDAFRAKAPAASSILWGDEDRETGRAGDEQLQGWIRQLPARTGIVAVNDSSAREILHACGALGRKVPDDIAVVGIDNDPLVAALAPLPISSVIQGAHEIGRKAAELLHDSMLGKAPAPVLLAVPPSGVNPAATSPRTCLVLRDALEYIARHAASGIKSEQVADHLGMSRTTLERLFAEHRGHSPHDEILHTRLGMAKQLLLSRTLSTAEVAERCGFRTQQYMHVVFKRELGLSPREFLLQERP